MFHRSGPKINYCLTPQDIFSPVPQSLEYLWISDSSLEALLDRLEPFFSNLFHNPVPRHAVKKIFNIQCNQGQKPCFLQLSQLVWSSMCITTFMTSEVGLHFVKSNRLSDSPPESSRGPLSLPMINFFRNLPVSFIMHSGPYVLVFSPSFFGFFIWTRLVTF